MRSRSTESQTALTLVRRALAGLCTVLLMASVTARANLIANGSFESPTGAISPGINVVYPTGWSGFGTMQLINGAPTPAYPAPYDGNQYVSTANGSLVQTFIVTAADDYELRWFENSLTTGWNGSYGVRIRDALSATVAFSPFSYSYLGSSPWKERGIDLLLNPGTYTLEFEPGTTFTFIDKVSLDQVVTSTVPDTGSSLGLLGLVLGGWRLVARRIQAA